jgi:hypothetical protein
VAESNNIHVMCSLYGCKIHFMFIESLFHFTELKHEFIIPLGGRKSLSK